MAEPPPPQEAEALPVSGAFAYHPHGFWQNPWVQQVLPFATSLLIHLSIVLVGWMAFRSIEKISTVAFEEQITIPDAGFTEGEVGGIPNPGLGEDPTRPAAQDDVQNVQNAEGWITKPSETLSSSVMSGGAGAEASSLSVIGIGGNSGAGRNAGAGSGESTGTGQGSGPIAAFGVPGGGGGIGPKFMGQGTGARTRSIIFVCDASGSMINKMFLLKRELQRTVDQMKVQQAFNIVFFADEAPQTLSPTLLMASPDNKRKAYEFLNSVTTYGSTDPIPGIEAAFRQQPQLIFLLTDGDFPDNKKVVDRIAQLNPGGKVKVNTIAFVNEDEENKPFIEVLKTIAKTGNGIFKRVGQNELQ